MPIDREIEEGNQQFDESMLAGESIPVEKGKGDEAIGGSINGEGSLTISVQMVGKETYLSR